MTNNLRKAKKDLCAFAKKCKDFKYTDSALITFLITGAVNISNNLFSAETDKNIRDQKQTISTSIKDIHHQAQEIRNENEKLLKKENLERKQQAFEKNKSGIDSINGARRSCSKIALEQLAIWN